MKLACNYMNEAAELLQSGEVDFDYFKFPSLKMENIDVKEYIVKIAKIKPILYHWLYPNTVSLCDENFIENFNVEGLKGFLKMARAPALSIHLDGGNPNSGKDMLVSTAVKNLEFIKNHFSYLDFISVENVERNANALLYNPDFIFEVVCGADVNFLFDYSHAVWSADDMGILFEDYVDRLPMKKCNEIHINGWNFKDGDMMAHIKIREESYGDIKRMADKYPIEIITCEYGRSNDKHNIGAPAVSFDSTNDKAKEELKEQILRLSDIVYNMNVV